MYDLRLKKKWSNQHRNTAAPDGSTSIDQIKARVFLRIKKLLRESHCEIAREYCDSRSRDI